MAHIPGRECHGRARVCVYRGWGIECTADIDSCLAPSHSDYFPAQNFVVISMDADEGIVHYVVEKSRWVCCNYRGCLYC